MVKPLLALALCELGRLDPLEPLDGGQELSWLGSAPWAKVALIITVAVFVLTVGGALAKRNPRRRSAVFKRGDFSLEIARLESLPVTPVAEAHDGPVHFEGVLASASETLGGDPGRERVYFNRSGAGRRSAVASELVLLRDESGQVSIEGLEGARVIAAKDPKPANRSTAPDTISLRLGDRVQLLGYFRGELHGRDESPTERVYGVVGEGHQIQIRVVPASEPTSDAPPSQLHHGASEASAPALATGSDPEHDHDPDSDPSPSDNDAPTHAD